MYLTFVCGGSEFVFVLICITFALSSFAITLTRKRELVAFFLWLFLTVSWVGLQFVIVVFSPDHTNLLFDVRVRKKQASSCCC